VPATPLHASVPWLAYARWPAAFSFWALTLGSMVPDLEVPIVWAATGDLTAARGAMHSVVGVLTLNAAITVVAVWLLVPPLLRWVDRTWPGTDILRFAGRDLRRDPRVSLCFEDGIDYVTIEGRAELSDDHPKALENIWAMARRYGQGEGSFAMGDRVDITVHVERVIRHR